MFEKYQVRPPEFAEWTIPQLMAVLFEPSDLKPGEIKCGSLQEAIKKSRELKKKKEKE